MCCNKMQWSKESNAFLKTGKATWTQSPASIACIMASKAYIKIWSDDLPSYKLPVGYLTSYGIPKGLGWVVPMHYLINFCYNRNNRYAPVVHSKNNRIHSMKHKTSQYFHIDGECCGNNMSTTNRQDPDKDISPLSVSQKNKIPDSYIRRYRKLRTIRFLKTKYTYWLRLHMIAKLQ